MFTEGRTQNVSLNKAIEHGKERRKPYRGAERYFRSCRNHGGCPWCKANRTWKFRDKHPEEPELDTDPEDDNL